MDKDKKLSELLKETRIAGNIALEKVFEDTYMPLKFINMMENGNWSEFPSEAHLKGYLRLYSSYLKIEKDIIDRHIDEIFSEDKKTNGDNADCVKENVKENRLFLNSSERKTIYTLLLLAVIFLIIFFLILYILPE